MPLKAQQRAGGVIVAYQSRLSRQNGLGTTEVYEALSGADARLVCVNEGIDTGDKNRNPADTRMFFSIQAAIARREWERSPTASPVDAKG